jgi:hypothetical protein|tara:strand:+ start:248 stop:472 length:225 start_codon:yes stop_codon:yes gene_type:complete
MLVIKIWLLISMLSVPGMPTVKHNAELWFDKDKCEARRIVIENDLNKAASIQGINPIFVHTWCLESSMFVINNT